MAVPALLLAGCSGGSEAAGTHGGAGSQTLTVLAAASLTDVLEPIIDDFQAQHAPVRVEASFSSSSTVVQQANEGAGADVVALAGEASLEPLEDELRAGPVSLFATNQLEIAVPPDNPADIGGLEDLTRDGVRLVVCAEQVPCGTAAAALFDQEGLFPDIASFENDVRAAVTKVELGEADAALVYRTDVAGAGDRVRGIEIPDGRNVVNRYPAVAVSEHELAQAFVEHLLSPEVQSLLVDAGFGPAPGTGSR